MDKRLVEIENLCAEGLTIKQIAERMDLSVQRIYQLRRANTPLVVEGGGASDEITPHRYPTSPLLSPDLPIEMLPDELPPDFPLRKDMRQADSRPDTPADAPWRKMRCRQCNYWMFTRDEKEDIDTDCLYIMADAMNDMQVQRSKESYYLPPSLKDRY